MTLSALIADLREIAKQRPDAVVNVYRVESHEGPLAIEGVDPDLDGVNVALVVDLVAQPLPCPGGGV